MMKLTTAIFVVCFTVSGALAQPPDTEDERILEGRRLSGAFMQELKGELETSLGSAGPVATLAVCQSRAPAIAARLSAETRWQVARTSLRVRNPANAPDSWEKGVLEDFDRRRQAGADPMSLEYAETVPVNGGKVLRYMKAIPTGEKCLLCHGTALDQAVEEELRRRYPQDRARGYAPGEIRGAFTLSRPLEGGGE